MSKILTFRHLDDKNYDSYNHLTVIIIDIYFKGSWKTKSSVKLNIFWTSELLYKSVVLAILCFNALNVMSCWMFSYFINRYIPSPCNLVQSDRLLNMKENGKI